MKANCRKEKSIIYMGEILSIFFIILYYVSGESRETLVRFVSC